jgi:hypothetical protein
MVSVRNFRGERNTNAVPYRALKRHTVVVSARVKQQQPVRLGSVPKRSLITKLSTALYIAYILTLQLIWLQRQNLMNGPECPVS